MLDKIPERALEIDLGNILYMSGHIFYIVNFRKIMEELRNAKYKFCQLFITDAKIWLSIQRVTSQNGLKIGLLLTYPKLPCFHRHRFQSDAS